MGKTHKTKKSRTKRHNPLKQPPKQKPAPVKSSDAIQPIIDKLASSDPQDRLWGCAAVTNIIHDDPTSRSLFLSNNIVGALIARLSDTGSDVATEAAGSLRNLCIDGGDDVIGEMFNKNMLPALISCVPRISQAITEFLERRKARLQESQLTVCDFAENIISLITCLAETSYKVLRALNKVSTTVISFLMLILKDHNHLPLRIVISAELLLTAECLYVLSDENSSIISSLKGNHLYLKIFRQIIQVQEPNRRSQQEREMIGASSPSTELHSARLDSLRMLSCGIMQNLDLLSDSSLGYSELVSALGLSLTEISSRASNLLSPKDSQFSDLPAHNRAITSTIDETLELECLEQRLINLQLCLEILTGISTIFPNSSFTSPSENTSDYRMDVDIKSGDKPQNRGANNDLGNGPLPSISKVLASLTEPLMKLVVPTEMSFQLNTAKSFHPSLTPLLSNIHIAALNCLSNLFISVDGVISSGEDSFNLSADDISSAVSLWSRIWPIFLSLAGNHMQWDCLDDAHLRMYQAVLGALWGVARICKGHLVPEGTDVGRILELCCSAIDDDIRVKCIGLLECIAHTPFNLDTNETICRFLFSFIRLPDHSHPEPALQAAAGIIDIFSDESRAYDVNFRRNGWLATLEECQDAMQKLAATLERSSGTRLHAEEVVENLIAFTEYRRLLAV